MTPEIRLTAQQAALHLGGVGPDGKPHLSSRQVLDAYRRGDLVGMRVTGRVLFRPEDLDAYLAARSAAVAERRAGRSA